MTTTPRPESYAGQLWEIFINYLPLGYITFGGPQAHVALLQAEFVEKKKWLPSQVFTELFGICTALPGPGSTQLAFSIALCRAGTLAAFLAFLLWSIPMLIVNIALAYGVSKIGTSPPLVLIHVVNGLIATAVGLVALASYTLGKKVCTDKLTVGLCFFSAACAIAYQAPWLDPSLIIFGGLTTCVVDNILIPCVARREERRKEKERKKEKGDDLLPPQPDDNDVELSKPLSPVANSQVSPLNGINSSNNSNDDNNRTINDNHQQTSHSHSHSHSPHSHSNAENNNNNLKIEEGKNGGRLEEEKKEKDLDSKLDGNDGIHLGYGPKVGLCWLVVWVLILVIFLSVRSKTNNLPLYIVSNLYIAGSLIFGGGPVVVPLLHAYVVDPGWLTDREFLLGVAFINALPGPNFNFAAYCGALALRYRSLIGGGLLGWFGIFFPGLALKLAILPFWKFVRGKPVVKTIFRGVNACAVGLIFFAVWVLWQKAVSTVPGFHFYGNALGAYPLYVILCGWGFAGPGLLGLSPLLVLPIGALIGYFKYLVDTKY